MQTIYPTSLTPEQYAGLACDTPVRHTARGSVRLDRLFAYTSFIAELAPLENSPSKLSMVTSKTMDPASEYGRNSTRHLRSHPEAINLLLQKQPRSGILMGLRSAQPRQGLDGRTAKTEQSWNRYQIIIFRPSTAVSNREYPCKPLNYPAQSQTVTSSSSSF